MIDLYYFPTPNTWKVSIMLEECGLDYKLIMVDIMIGEQFESEFLKLSPNNRVPAIVDHDVTNEKGEPVSIMESGAIRPRTITTQSLVLFWLRLGKGGEKRSYQLTQ